jgi:hypothetical protein
MSLRDSMIRGFCARLEKLGFELDDVEVSRLAPTTEQPPAGQPEAAADQAGSSEQTVGAVGDLGGAGARVSFEKMLGSSEGRQSIRTVMDRMRDQATKLDGFKKAFVRSLLRARRDVFGPSPSPRSDLRKMLYNDTDINLYRRALQ